MHLLSAEPRSRPYRLSDGKGLAVQVLPNGTKAWRYRYRYRYRFAGRERMISLGLYPAVSLEAARRLRDEARDTLERGVDPSAERRARKCLEAQTFGAIASDWLSGGGRYVFPAARDVKQPMCAGALNVALRRLGYRHDEMTAHGFRTTASIELGYRDDVIERHLAHSIRGRLRSIYNQAEYLAERREMMQAWADYLDRLRRFHPSWKRSDPEMWQSTAP